MGRGHILIVAGALALCLIAGSPQRLVGDGREYLAQAVNFASFHGPAFRPADIPSVQSEIARFDPALANWDIWGATVADAKRGRVFLHFWFYALLATPGVWITTLLRAPPTFAFTALNLVLLGTALWVALPRIGTAACLLLFAGPIMWWIDKAHTEVFTFALLTITFALMREQPWWSMLAAGAASTQNPPLAILVGLVFIAGAIARAVRVHQSARHRRRRGRPRARAAPSGLQLHSSRHAVSPPRADALRYADAAEPLRRRVRSNAGPARELPSLPDCRRRWSVDAGGTRKAEPAPRGSRRASHCGGIFSSRSHARRTCITAARRASAGMRSG